MDDRVRIYELARRMNVPNGDVITVLRELGYDIKSHSSTIDKTAVGLLIAAIDKKKQKAENDPKGKAKAAPVTTPSKSPAAKAPAKLPPPPEPVVVKPRVPGPLSSRKNRKPMAKRAPLPAPLIVPPRPVPANTAVVRTAAPA